MQDRSPKYPGRVKLTPVDGQENVFDMVRADEPEQEGTALSKKNLLQDATAALFGLGPDAVPDDVFGAIDRKYNVLFQHYWRRRIESNGYAVEIAAEAPLLLVFSPYNISVQYMYFDSYTVNSNGYFVPVSPTYVTFSYNSPDNANKLIGKYICDATELEYVAVIHKVPSTATVEKGYTPGDESNYFYLRLTAASKYTTQYYESSGEWQIVSASDLDAYPNGTVNGINYQYLGIPLENAIEGTKIATGSYVGTGKYGSSNPTSITFNFVPKLVVINTGLYANNLTNALAILTGNPTTAHDSLRIDFSGSSPIVSKDIVASVSGNTISWYATTTNSYYPGLPDLNTSGQKYYYIAFG